MNYKDYNDYELLYMIKENDDEAIDIMIGKYEPIIRTMASSFSYNYNVEMDDLVQEGRIAVYKSINTYKDNKALFYTYVMVAIKNAMLSFCNKEFNKNKRINSYYSFDDLDYCYGYEYNYISSISDNDFYEELVNFRNSLSFNDSCIFELRYNDFSYKDIAILLDISLKKVDNSLYLMKKSLHKYIEAIKK